MIPSAAVDAAGIRRSSGLVKKSDTIPYSSGIPKEVVYNKIGSSISTVSSLETLSIYSSTNYPSIITSPKPSSTLLLEKNIRKKTISPPPPPPPNHSISFFQTPIHIQNIVPTTSKNMSILSQEEDRSIFLESLPRQLMNQDMIYEATQVLLDETFFIRRCCELGLYKATKYHVRDWDRILQKVTHPETNESYDKKEEEEEKGNNNNNNEQSIFDALNQSPELAMVDVDDDDDESRMDLKRTSSNIQSNKNKNIIIKRDEKLQQPSVETIVDARITSFEMYRQCILALCKQQQNVEQRILLPQDIPTTFTFLEGGQALWILGLSYYTSQQQQHYHHQALTCYYQSLYFLFLEQGYEETLFLHSANEMDESDTSLFILLCNKVKPSTTTLEAYRLVGIVFTRIGDVYSQKEEDTTKNSSNSSGVVNAALHCYKTAYEYSIRLVQFYFPQYNYETSSSSSSSLVEIIQEALSKEEEEDEPSIISSTLLIFAGICKRIGAVYNLQELYIDAVSYYERTLELQICIVGSNHVDVGKTLHDIGVAERHAGHWDLALKYYAKAHKIFEDSYGSEHLDTVRTLHNIGGIYRRQKEYDKALICFREVLRVRRKLLGDKHPSVSLVLVSIGSVLRHQGKLQEAYKYYNRAMK